MTPAELASIQPRQPTPPLPPRSSTFPDQIEHEPSHDRARSPKSSLPDYHDPDSPTQKRGPGIPRNPVADTWREDAYLKKEASDRKISSAEAGKMQDRWRCEYCNALNEREAEATPTPDPNDPRVGAAGPSTAYVTKAHPPSQKNNRFGDYSANSSVRPTGPVRIPDHKASGIWYTRCRYCGETLPWDLSRYDPREFSEMGRMFDFQDVEPEAREGVIRKAWAKAQRRVFFRWNEDKRRAEEEERRARSEERKARQKQREEEECRSPLGWNVRPGSEERAHDDGSGEEREEEREEDEGEGGDAEDGEDEWEDENETGNP
jgi:hypothetical protein